VGLEDFQLVEELACFKRQVRLHPLVLEEDSNMELLQLVETHSVLLQVVFSLALEDLEQVVSRDSTQLLHSVKGQLV
jgi:hypothetical protein